MKGAEIVPMFHCPNCDERTEKPNWFCIDCEEATRSWDKSDWRRFEAKVSEKRAEEAWHALERQEDEE